MISQRPHRSLLLVSMALLVFASSPARADALSLDQAVALALKHNSALHQARAQVDAAEASRKKVRGGYGPSLSAGANLQIWDSEHSISIAPDAPPPFNEPFVAREQITGQINLTLTQPITPLYQVHKGQKLAAMGRDAAKLGWRRAQQSIAGEAKKAYLNVLRARAGQAIAKSAVEQVTAGVEKARAFERAGLIGKNDLLKAEVALAQAEEGKIKAEAGVALAQSALAAVLGLSPDKRFTLTEKPGVPAAYGRSLSDCVKQAQQNRAELQIAQAQARIARGQGAIEKWNYVPQLVALAQYQHTIGGGDFQPANAFFVGGALNWKLFEWGKTHYSVKAAEHKTKAAEYALPLLRARIHLEVKKAYLDLQVAQKTMAVAKRSIEQAREGYRIEQVRFSKQAATATDLLDAQLALTRSELSFTNSLYGWHIARAALDQAMGASVKGASR